MAGALTGKTVVITGSTSGIGKAAATELAPMGPTLVLVARNQEKAEQVRKQLVIASGNEDIHLLIGDLSVMSEVKRVAVEFNAAYEKLDVLINNAGLILDERTLTKDGYEYTFALNHLAYFYFTQLVLDYFLTLHQINSRALERMNPHHQNPHLNVNS